jgi:RNA polymerase sigma factor (sigma-70 family)
MAETNEFRALVVRAQAGDEEAQAELYRIYAPYVRRWAEAQLRDSRLRRRLDAEDICQQVMKSFFLRVEVGTIEIDTPEKLMGLLATMTRNKVASANKREGAKRRDCRRDQDASGVADEVPGEQSSPSSHVAKAELVAKIRERLTAEERALDDRRRRDGKEWAEIAAELGVPAETLRKRYERALKRVADELGLRELTDE